jgi:hypothetical protein
MKEFKSATGRTSLPVQKAPHRHEPTLGQGYNLLLRRNKNSNIWIAFVQGKEQRLGNDVQLAYEDAVTRVHDLASAIGKGVTPSTVLDAFERYKVEKSKAGENTKSITGILRKHLPALKDKVLSATTVREWEDYRDSLMTTEKASTARRKWATVHSALEQAVVRDELARKQWSFVKRPEEDCESRNVVLPEGIVPQIVREAQALDPSFGLLMELMAETGMRPCQLQDMTAGDVLDRSLMVPKSNRGKGKKKGQPEKGEKVRYATSYSLRHTHIIRMLLKFGSAKKKTIARLHDTSSVQLDKTYAMYLHKHDDEDLSLFSCGVPQFMAA